MNIFYDNLNKRAQRKVKQIEFFRTRNGVADATTQSWFEIKPN